MANLAVRKDKAHAMQARASSAPDLRRDLSKRPEQRPDRGSLRSNFPASPVADHGSTFGAIEYQTRVCGRVKVLTGVRSTYAWDSLRESESA